MEIGYDRAKEYMDVIQLMDRDFKLVLLADLGYTVEDIHLLLDSEEPHVEIVEMTRREGRLQQLFVSVHRVVALRRAMRLMSESNPDYETDPWFEPKGDVRDEDH